MSVRTVVTLFLSVLVLAAIAPGTALAGEGIKFQVNTLRVDCNAGGAIQPALLTDFVRPFAEDATTIPPAEQLVIEFEGTCVGDVWIERDDVVLRGLGPDATIVGGISVLGATKVRLEHFTQRDGEFHGIGVTRGGSIIVEDVDAHGNAGNGLSVYDHSAAWVIDSSFVDNTWSGIAMWGHASLKQSGTLRANGNGFIGVFVNTGSAWDWVFLDTAAVTEANDNDVVGVALQFGATAWVQDLTARGNGFAGLFLYASSFEAPSVDLAGSPYGALAELNSSLALDDGSVANNIYGIYADEDAQVDLIGLDIHDNMIGLALDGASAWITGCGSHDNSSGLDAYLTFGARADFAGGNAMGNVVCDGTCLTRGDTGCGFGLADAAPALPERQRVGPFPREP